MDDIWTVEVILINGDTKLIVCNSRQKAEDIKNDWFKNNANEIKYLYVISGDITEKRMKEKSNIIAGEMLKRMFV